MSVGYRFYNILFGVLIFFCVGNALQRNKTDDFFHLLRRVERKVTVDANIDKLLDESLPKIRGAIISSGMDPLEMDDMIIPVTALPWIFKGKVILNNGWLQQLSHIKRVGNSRMSYSDKKLTIEMSLGWENLSFDYRYLLEYMLYKRKGNVHGAVGQADVYFVFVMDFANYQIILEKVKFRNTGKYELQLEGHLTDKILNYMVKVINTFSKDFISKKLQKIFRTIAEEEVKEINKNLKNIIEGQ